MVFHGDFCLRIEREEVGMGPQEGKRGQAFFRGEAKGFFV
jgi:hypothetical protein